MPGTDLAVVDRLRTQMLHTPQVRHFAVELLAGTSPRVELCALCACCQHANCTDVVEIVPARKPGPGLVFGRRRGLSCSPTHSIDVCLLRNIITSVRRDKQRT